MSIVDGAVILIILSAVYGGYKSGFIQVLGKIIGFVLAVFLAVKISDVFAHTNLSKVMYFLITFALVNSIVGLIFYIAGKVFNVISFIPFLKTFNRLLGAVLGLVEGIIVCALIIIVLTKFPFNEWLTQSLDASFSKDAAMYLFNMLSFILPKSFEKFSYFT